jgi:hypothetical protein
MNALLALMVGLSIASIAFGLTARRRVGPGPLIGEVVMVVAMLDVHGADASVLATPGWAATLAACAVGTALLDRVRRAGSRARSGDALHPIGMLLGALLLLFAGAPAVLDGGSDHGHRGAALDLLLVVLPMLLGYAVLVLWDSVRRRRGARLAREVASLAALLAMGAMVALG